MHHLEVRHQTRFTLITYAKYFAWHFKAPITCGGADWAHFPAQDVLKGKGRTAIQHGYHHPHHHHHCHHHHPHQPSLHSQICLRGTSKTERFTSFVFWPGHGVCCREMAGILAWFWNERFWLPHNVTWADLKNTDEATFPQAEDLYLACPLAFCIFMIRLIFERWVWAHAFGAAVDRVDVGGWCSTARCPRFSTLFPKQWHLIRAALGSLARPLSAGLSAFHVFVSAHRAQTTFQTRLFIYISAEQCTFSLPTLLWFWFLFFIFFLTLLFSYYRMLAVVPSHLVKRCWSLIWDKLAMVTVIHTYSSH